MSKKYVYLFSEANGTMKNLLGGKGANLAEMTSLGLPVPQGFTVSTEACTRYYEDGKTIAPEIENEIYEFLGKMEDICGKKFGDKNNPLLVSVRSGARASMPGMMDTILNLGINDEVVLGLAELTGNERFAYDSYRRFIQMFSDVVMELEKKNFETIIDELKEEKGITLDIDLTADDMKTLVARFKDYYSKSLGSDFPQDPKVQLIESVKAVFRSWDNDRAIYYRRMNDIPSSWGTAVNVQSMVFGNMGNTSGTGVAFTRNPATGEKKLFGEFLMNAQGEDVVAGIRTPQPISQMKDEMPQVYNQFVEIADMLDNHYRDMQDMEFTIENGTLYMLQTRSGKRTGAAAVKIAIDLVAEGMATKQEAIMKVDPNNHLDALLHDRFDADALKNVKVLATGLGASPGAVSGEVVFSAEDVVAAHEAGKKVVLVRLETSPEDIEGMNLAQGFLTVRGGMTSHAAVVARGMGKCCVSGCGAIRIDEEKKVFYIGDRMFKEFDCISLDGTTGNVYGEPIPTVEAEITDDFATFMSWVDEVRTLKVRTNADTPKDAAKAVEFGAEGIGLCRTEHMFFDSERIPALREMIVAPDVEARRKALEKLLPVQQSDFEGIYEAMGERPVTIRYLDPPLHEFLPQKKQDVIALADSLGMSLEALEEKIHSLEETNPMMGHRGCRLAVSYPEIAEIQTKAVIQAAIAVQKRHPEWKIVPEIMIPLVGNVRELEYVKKIVDDTAGPIIAASGVNLKYSVGTMIEVPRAALTADEIAKEAEFFSFGTNDLTQLTMGFSRDDAGKFLNDYYEKKILENDPFARLDQTGVGKLVEMSVKLGKQTRPTIKLGICGEHGGDPSTVDFCHRVGLNYVSCSPFRVPVARLAAAQAQIVSPK